MFTWIGGVVSGIYTGHINYENGASLGGAIISGVIDGMVIMASIGNLAFLSKMESSLLTDIACEAVFGSAGNIISAAASQSAIILGDSDKFSNNNISSHKNQTLDFLNDIKNRARTKVLNGRTVTFGKYMSYVDEDDYNKIYFNVTFS